MSEVERWLARAAGAAAALAIVAGVALASRAEMGEPARGAELRLALRAARARLEICRQRTAEELARLPAHLRAPEDCDEVAIDYRLVVEIDGERRLDQVVSHRGVRRTRPLAVEEAVAIPPGRHGLEVTFLPVRPPELGETSANQPGEGHSGDSWLEAFRALPAPRLVGQVDFRSGRAVLVTLADDGTLQMAR